MSGHLGGAMTATSILVLCTGNSARSILGEALLNRLGSGQVTAYSAGSKPAGGINPGAMRLLQREGYDVSAFRSKSWSEFSDAGAPTIELVLTVCGNAAGETCPVFPGNPIRGHWGLPDPAAIQGDDAAIDAAFAETYANLQARVEALFALPFETLPREELQAQLARIGAMAGAA